MSLQCKGKTRGGNRCRNIAIDVIGYCRSHHPEITERSTTGTPFEEKVVKVLRLLGYKVNRNVTINGCQIDIFAEYRTGIIPHRLMVECKDHRGNKEVGIEEINKFVGVLSPAKGRVIDKGLFVTTYGFTRHAREYAENAGIQCATFSDLSTQLVDFDYYVDNIIVEFERSQLSKYYIDLSGTEVEDYEGIDPSTFHRPLDNLINRFLFEERGKLALLGNFGTGKSTFCRKYAYDLAKKYRKDPTARIPLLIDLSDYDKKQNIQEVVTSTLQYRYGVRIDPLLCQELQRLGRFVLLFDGFDEMAAQVDLDTIRDNLREMNKISQIPENRFLLTCRTHFFRDRVQAEVLTDFDIIYIPEWGELELKAFLKKRFGITWREQLDRIRGTHNLEELAQTPLFLEMIVETLPKLGDQVRRIELYQVYTDKWIKKQTDHRGARLTEEERKQFINDLAMRLYAEGNLSCHYSTFWALLRERFQIEDAAKIDYLQNDVRTCTFLTRDSNGNYSFRHKSFMEFFVAQSIAKEIRESSNDSLRKKPLLVEIAGFLVESLSIDPPVDTLKSWLRSTDDKTLRENVLLLLARLGVDITDDVSEKEPSKRARKRLAAQFIQGDTRAFDEAFTLFREPLVNYVETMVEDRGLAEDIVIDAYISAFQRPDQFEQVSDVKKYLFAIARNKTIDHLRRNSKVRFVPIGEIDEGLLPTTDDTSEPSAESSMIQEQLLTETLMTLSEEDRRILLSGFGLGEPVEVARLLNISTGALRMKRYRLLKQLRYILKEKYSRD